MISFNWLHCHGSRDLSTTKLRLTDQFKSLFRYGIPSLISAPIRPRCTSRSSTSPATARGHNPAGPDGQQLSKRLSGFHRHTRSDLEHAAKLLRPHANEAAAVPQEQPQRGPQESEASQRWPVSCWAKTGRPRSPTNVP